MANGGICGGLAFVVAGNGYLLASGFRVAYYDRSLIRWGV